MPEPSQTPDMDDRPADLSYRNARRINAYATRGKAQGTPGTYIPGGLITGVEDNRALTADKALGTVYKPGVWEKMEREDPQIAGMVRSLKSVLLAAPWKVEPPRDADDTDIEIAEFVQAQLGGLDKGFKHFLREALTFVTRGFWLGEEVYRRLPDGRLGFKRFGSRLQRTVFAWNVGDDDELSSVEFEAPFGGDRIRRYSLPARCLLHFALDQEGNNFAGTSILRPVYTYWLIKRHVLRATAIDTERAGQGFLDFRQTEQSATPTQDDVDRYHEIALNWRTNEFAHMISKWGWEAEFTFPDIPYEARIAFVRYLDQQMAKAFLATFLELGLDKAGTQALGGTLTEHFMLALKGIADYIEDVLNGPGGTTVSGSIQRLVDMNWGRRDRYPAFRFGQINPDAARAAVDAMFKGMEIGAFGDIGREDNEHARQSVGMPPLPAEDDTEPADAGDGGDDGAGADEQPEPVAVVDAEPGDPATLAIRAGTVPVEVMDGLGRRLICHRPLFAAEEAVAFTEIAQTFDDAAAAVVKGTKPVLDNAARRLARSLRDTLAESDDEIEQLQAIREIGFTFAERRVISRSILQAIQTAGEQAEGTAARDVARQMRRGGLQPRQKGAAAEALTPVSLDDFEFTDIGKLSEIQAQMAADAMAAEIETGIRSAGSRAVSSGSAIPLRDADQIVSVRADGFFRKHSSEPIGRVVNAARENGSVGELKRLGVSEVSAVMFSSVLDGNTCSPCAREDGREFALGSAEYFRLRPPYVACDGRGSCRCIFVVLG